VDVDEAEGFTTGQVTGFRQGGAKKPVLYKIFESGFFTLHLK